MMPRVVAPHPHPSPPRLTTASPSMPCFCHHTSPITVTKNNSPRHHTHRKLTRRTHASARGEGTMVMPSVHVKNLSSSSHSPHRFLTHLCLFASPHLISSSPDLVFVSAHRFIASNFCTRCLDLHPQPPARQPKRTTLQPWQSQLHPPRPPQPRPPSLQRVAHPPRPPSPRHGAPARPTPRPSPPSRQASSPVSARPRRRSRLCPAAGGEPTRIPASPPRSPPSMMPPSSPSLPPSPPPAQPPPPLRPTPTLSPASSPPRQPRTLGAASRTLLHPGGCRCTTSSVSSGRWTIPLVSPSSPPLLDPFTLPPHPAPIPQPLLSARQPPATPNPSLR